MFEHLDAIPWNSFVQPSGNAPRTISDAIDRLAAADSADEAERAYHHFLHSVGNNHAGTYFPVVLHTLPFLEDIIRRGSSLARNAALDTLIDLVGSFEPEPNFRVMTVESGEQRAVRDVLRERIVAFQDLVMRFALDISAERRTRELAGDLLELLQRSPDAA